METFWDEKVEKPGLYLSIPMEKYHGSEICPSPSISGSGLKALSACPIKYWVRSPLNPDFRFDDGGTRATNFGAAMHDRIAYGRSWLDRWHIVPDGFSRHHVRKWAEEIAAYDAAIAAGKRILRQSELGKIEAMAEALSGNDLVLALYADGYVEPTLAWQDEETGVWLRARPDFLPSVHAIIPDYKTCHSADPADWPKIIMGMQYHWSAALIFMGVHALTGEWPRDFVFVAQEKEPPFVVQIIQLDREAIGWGMSEVRRAIRKFADLLERRERWPAYGDEICIVGLPEWRLAQLAREAQDGLIVPGWESLP